jgi:chemosensory pili system protein ChpA (sensor histidine kinase/response regulator)
MPNQTSFDLASLAVVKPGMDEALRVVDERLAQFLDEPKLNAHALEEARTELHRVQGVLRMIRLDGVAVFCAEINLVLAELSVHPGLVSHLYRSVLKSALDDMSDYLDALMQGADNAALRLFPKYEAMQHLRGMEMSFEQDLFYPNLALQLPESVLGIAQPTDYQSLLKVAHSRYQRGLILWLQKNDVAGAVLPMKQALDTVLSCVRPGDERAFWWIAGGLLDCARLESQAQDLSVRKLLGRIDRQMRAVAKDETVDVQPVLNEMLYLIGKNAAGNEQVQQIRTHYALAQYFPAMVNSAEEKQSYEELRDQMQEAEDNWEQCVAGDKEACNKFVGYIEKIAQKSDRLEHNTPHYLTKKIEALSAYLRDPEYARLIGEDVAMALMLWRSGMTQYETIDTRFQEQARILSEQIDAAMSQKPEDAERISALIRLYGQTEQGAVTASLANEMLANLQLVEQGLNEFFDDVAKRPALSGLQRLLVQIHGGLHILSLKHAEQLLLEIQALVRYFVDSEAVPKPAETQALARAVSTLHAYLEHLSHGQKDDMTAIRGALAELSRLREVSGNPAIVPVAAVVTPVAGTAPVPLVAVKEKRPPERPPGEDTELLEIFLEEAHEVLSIMRDNIEISQMHPENQEPLITMRRGFHTLKGSGRMVGLIDLGEVAWAAERAMQKCLQDKKPNHPDLLPFIVAAVQAFSGWIDELAQQGYAYIEGRDLIARARQIESGALPETVAATAVKQPDVPDNDFKETESVVIGDISLSPTLFKIASEEAAQNVAALRRQFGMMLTSQPQRASYDFMRAAHTLAGICRSLGFMSVVELSAGLEGWLQTNLDIPLAINAGQLHLLEQVIAALDVMVQRICAKQMPPKSDELTQQLAADRNRIVSENERLALLAESGKLAEPAEVLAAAETSEPEPVELDMTEAALIPEPVAAAAELLEPAQASGPETESESESESELELEAAAPATESMADMPVKPPQTAEAVVQTEWLRPVHGRELASLRDDVDEQLLPIFLEEADELCPKIGGCLRNLREEPHGDLHLLNRLLHTLKGSARMTGAMRIGDIAHEMEGRLLGGMALTSEECDTLEADLDHLNLLLDELRGGGLIINPLEETRSGQPALEEESEDAAVEATPAGFERAQQASMLRVRSDVVDRLVNQAGEISVARARMETELRAFKEGLMELTGSVTRLRKQLREVEIQAESQIQARVSLASENDEQFDPLEFDRFTRLQELTRFMNESVHDVQTVQQALLKNLDETSSALFAQGRLNRDLQQNLMSVRMVPFSSMSERLYRLVRQTAKELNKRANLELTGSGVELDRSVLEKMAAPFEHLLRNAIAHGLESEQLRIDSGKPAIGEVLLSLRQESNEVVFELSDDGAGLNFAALRSEAIKKGLLEAHDVSLSDDQLAQLIFTTGFSTATEVTEVAGRGIGMDVVRSEITALGGRIDVTSVAGQGTKFTIHLPLTLAVTQVLMVRAGERIYAIPSTMVEQVRQLKPAELSAVYAEQKVEWEGTIYPFHYLPAMLGDDERVPEVMPHNPLLLLRSGNQCIALHVDELRGNQETVVKNIGPQLARLPGIAGATVMGNGAVVLILNPTQLAQRIVTRKVRREEKIVPQVQPLIMVVDDSLTVRKITSRLLQRAGYQVITAKDGVDALEQLTEITPSVMLLDIEMPRMDGFELTKLMRREAKTKSLPIIMITSRTADKHRDLALALGVNVYLGKPFQEEELLAHIAGFLPAVA